MYQILSLDVECETLGGESWKLDVKCVAEIDQIDRQSIFKTDTMQMFTNLFLLAQQLGLTIWIEGE